MEVFSFVLLIYGVLVLYLTLTKSNLVFKNPKTKILYKVLGEKGTYVFFLLIGLIALIIGLYLQS
jgi:hypothetical protein